jgi:hypothetical protein
MYRERRSPHTRTPCAIVPSTPAHFAYSCLNSSDFSLRRAVSNAAYRSRGRTGMVRRCARVHRLRLAHAWQSFLENLILMT